MKTSNYFEKQIWILVSLLITYLLLGSFVISKNIYDLLYLLIFYLFKIVANFNIRKENLN